LMTGLLEPSGGSISVGDGGVALVFQEAFLFADTLAYNITLGAEIPAERQERAIDIAQCRVFVDALETGLDTTMGERGVSLSGGQRQRVALARAIAHDRALLLLDDTTSALDPATEAKVINNLRSLAGRQTVLVVASRPSTIALADEVLFMADGRISDRGTHDELLRRSPKYQELIRAFEDDRQKK
ncbi:MAG: ATP-binding cassette domain-containing protein, partial [Actinomycetota bacterium]